jgi:hypothetical protein
MLTPKAKAAELIDRFVSITLWNGYVTSARECALIAVNELLTELEFMPPEYVTNLLYWREVKAEIEKS